jgi:hypothetical protein
MCVVVEVKRQRADEGQMMKEVKKIFFQFSQIFIAKLR